MPSIQLKPEGGIRLVVEFDVLHDIMNLLSFHLRWKWDNSPTSSGGVHFMAL